MQERRQGVRDVVEHAFPALLLSLDLIPLPAHRAGSGEVLLSEDVRVAPDQLFVRVPCNLLEVSLALLRQEQGQYVDLEEEIAELVEELRRVVCEGGVGDLVGLFHRVRHDRPCRLLTVPGAVAP